MYFYNYAKITTEIESTISFLHTKSVLAYETCLQNEKNTKAFVNLLNFGMGLALAGLALGAFNDVSKRFQNTNLQSCWLPGNRLLDSQ